MQFDILILVLLQVINIVYPFRDYPANSTPVSAFGLRKNRVCSNCTVYGNSFAKVFTRKRRGFVFYKGSVVVITDVTAKHLISPYPRGMIQSNEIDIFYDVPLAVDGWRQPFNDYIKGMKAKARMDKLEEEENAKVENIGVVNASAIPLDDYNKMTYVRPTWRKNLLDFRTNSQNTWNSNQRKYQERYRRPYYRKPSGNYNQNDQRRNYVPYRSQNSTFSSNRPQQSTYIKPYRHSTSSQTARNPNSNKTPSWHNHREYRERRDIYEQLDTFGKALGKKLRKCILRAICEMQEELLPEGESFINDVARIIFTVPTDHDNRDDEFVQMALEKNVDCARRFMFSCPHSPLNYFMNNFKPKTPRPTTPPIEKMS